MNWGKHRMLYLGYKLGYKKMKVNSFWYVANSYQFWITKYVNQ